MVVWHHPAAGTSSSHIWSKASLQTRWAYKNFFMVPFYVSNHVRWRVVNVTRHAFLWACDGTGFFFHLWSTCGSWNQTWWSSCAHWDEERNDAQFPSLGVTLVTQLSAAAVDRGVRRVPCTWCWSSGQLLQLGSSRLTWRQYFWWRQ